jgi:hypothetical protein
MIVSTQMEVHTYFIQKKKSSYVPRTRSNNKKNIPILTKGKKEKSPILNNILVTFIKFIHKT